MSKRRAVAEAHGSSPAKRLHLNLDDIEDDRSTAHSPSSVLDEDPESPVTAATTPRGKFPSDLKTLACTWPGCPKTFNRPARLRDHLNSHTNSRPFQCPYDDCDKDYTVDKHLKQHIKAVHTHERKHVCQREGCGKSFVTGTRLKRHQAVHEGADRFRCGECGQSFRKKDTLAKHVRKDHQGLTAFACNVPGCHAGFDTKSSLKRHQDKEHGELKFWCDECGLKTLEDGTEQRVGFTTELLLQAHMKLEHQNCMFCEFKSSAQHELERHIEMYHSGKSVDDRKTEECTHPGCGKKFTNKSNRNNHMRTAHEGLRFVCGEIDFTDSAIEGWSNDQGCGDKFCAKARLEDHIRFVHLGQERPKLSSGTTQSVSLLDDISGLADEAKRTIPCQHCGITFVRYADLDVHMDTHHGDVFNPDLPPTAVLSEDHCLDQVLFDNDFNESPWPEGMEHDEIFAAEMKDGQANDDWVEDEANILLLARDQPGLEIDPALTTL